MKDRDGRKDAPPQAASGRDVASERGAAAPGSAPGELREEASGPEVDRAKEAATSAPDAQRAAALEARIAKLETELAALVEARAGGRAVIALEIVDEAGTTRAMLSTGADQTVSLNLLDAAGRLRAAIGLATGNPTLALFDPGGARRLELNLAGDDVPRLLLADPEGGRTIDAAVDAASTASVGIHDATGKARAVLMATATGRGVVAASR